MARDYSDDDTETVFYIVSFISPDDEEDEWTIGDFERARDSYKQLKKLENLGLVSDVVLWEQKCTRIHTKIEGIT